MFLFVVTLPNMVVGTFCTQRHILQCYKFRKGKQKKLA